MLIPLSQLPMARVDGVIHIGAHEAEELPGYLCQGIRRIAWIEANPEKADKLSQLVGPFSEMSLGIFAASSLDQELILNVANNGQSSSILDFGTHLEEHPHIFYSHTIPVKCHTVDDWISRNQLNRCHYNFINLDIQGYELEALKGLKIQLEFVDFVYTEVNTAELYRGCPLISQIDQFLAEYGFVRLMLQMTEHGWGDAFYFKASPKIPITSF